MPTEIEDWVDSAVNALSINARKLPSEDARRVLEILAARFLSERPQMWWWTALKDLPAVVSAESEKLSAILPTLEGVGVFVPGTEDRDEPVYQVPLADIEKLVAECPFFEYCVSNEGLDWLVIESHHNEFYISTFATRIPGSIK